MKTDKKKKEKKFIWKKGLIILFWLLFWQILAWVIDNKILLEGPIGVLTYLVKDIQTIEYYRTVCASLIRIMSGVLSGAILAIAFGSLAYKKKWMEDFLLPVIQFMKSAPITCFVVLLLIWVGAENITFFIALLVTFPPIYLNLLEGLKQIDERKLELAKVYTMPYRNRFRYIYLPGVKSYFISALSVAIGMAFKAGIAAEIIGTPEYSMGERIYMSKIYLETEGVLSWMITVIFVAYLCEKIIIRMVELYFNRKPKISRNKGNTVLIPTETLALINCSASYDNKDVFQDISVEFKAGKVYAVTGESGIGKTTLLKVMWGLKKLDKGEVKGNSSLMAGVFQENRLFEEYTAIENIYATGQCAREYKAVQAALGEILPEKDLEKPVKEYSGGMKRRVEIARAMLSEGSVILMDEPFAGLDEKTKENTILFIEKYKNNRTILLTTHCPSDITKVKAEEYQL